YINVKTGGRKHMGTIILVIFILVLLLCFCIYNSWERHEKNKRMFEHEKKTYLFSIIIKHGQYTL
ncbi:MAG: hypothetical protein ACYDG2_14490, partial [Ruminiclostridium sp.]